MSRYAISLLLLVAMLLGLGPAAVRGQDATPAAVAEEPRTLLDVTFDRAQLPGEEGLTSSDGRPSSPGPSGPSTPLVPLAPKSSSSNRER
jgi:hypothetical protein